MRTTPRAPLPDGTHLQNGEFRIEKHLGTGSYGITYRAYDKDFNRSVAIKEFFPDECRRDGKNLIPGGDWDEQILFESKKDFADEGKTIAKLKKHNGIIVVYRTFEENATVYLVMEYVQGQTLKDYLEETADRRLPAEEAILYIRQSGEALTVVHAAGILHRDLKPANIMRREDGQIVLIDFGAARDFTPEQVITLTIINTPGYAAPEQDKTRAEWGNYTDIYGLAATLYRLVTGKTPKPAKLRVDAQRLRLPDPLLAPRDSWSDVPLHISQAIMKGMALLPADRPQTVEAFLKLLVDDPTERQENFNPATVFDPFGQLFQDMLTPPQPRLPYKINPKDGQKMILIPAGDFLMGDSDQNRNPRRSVTLDAYYIAETPVSVGQYEKFCRETRRTMPPEPEYPAGNKFNPGWRYKDHPIVNVKWQDAVDYCAWAGGKLPTEAQWEKAARGTEGRKYPWGEDWEPSKCRCSLKEWGDSGGTAAVGSYPNGASPDGVLDMAGNVFEWCEDFYDENYHQTAPPKNPVNLRKSEYRAARGGSWGIFGTEWFRAADRSGIIPDFWVSDLGFRVVSSQGS